MTITNLQTDRPTNTPGALLPTWLIAYRAPVLAVSEPFVSVWGNDVRLPIAGHDGWYLDGSTSSDNHFGADDSFDNGQDISHTIDAGGNTTGTYYGRFLNQTIAPADVAIVLPQAQTTDIAMADVQTSGVAVTAFVPVTSGQRPGP